MTDSPEEKGSVITMNEPVVKDTHWVEEL